MDGDELHELGRLDGVGEGGGLRVVSVGAMLNAPNGPQEEVQDALSSELMDELVAVVAAAAVEEEEVLYVRLCVQLGDLSGLAVLVGKQRERLVGWVVEYVALNPVYAVLLNGGSGLHHDVLQLGTPTRHWIAFCGLDGIPSSVVDGDREGGQVQAVHVGCGDGRCCVLGGVRGECSHLLWIRDSHYRHLLRASDLHFH